MSSTAAADRSFSVKAQLDGSGPQQPAGTIRIDAENMVHIVHAEPPFADLLELAANSLNQSDHFKVRTVPADAEPFSLHMRTIPRDSDEAPEAILTVLRKQYGLLLEAA